MFVMRYDEVGCLFFRLIWWMDYLSSPLNLHKGLLSLPFLGH